MLIVECIRNVEIIYGYAMFQDWHTTDKIWLSMELLKLFYGTKWHEHPPQWSAQASIDDGASIAVI